MKHLFLTSSIAIEGVGESIRAKLGHDRQLKTVFIVTPVEGEVDQSDLSWVEEERVGLNKNGFITFDYSITGKTLSQIQADLKDIDILYISGGNEFYLKEKSNESNFDQFVKDFINKGGIYIGTSCGSIIAGKDMSPLLKLSDHNSLSKPADAHGFGLVNFTILPHWGSTEFQDRWLNDDSFGHMYSSNATLIALNNFEYVEVNDEDFRIVDVRREK
jgi:dipeptidase E